MAEALEGLFSGIGQGMAQAGQMGAKDYFQKSRLKLRQKLNAEAKAEDREFQKQQTQEQREYQSQQAEQKREYQREQSERQFEKQKELAEYKAELAPKEEVVPWDQKKRFEVLSTELDHYNNLEEQLLEKSGGMMEQQIMGTDDVNTALERVRSQKKTINDQLNQMVGAKTPQLTEKSFFEDVVPQVPQDQASRQEALAEWSNDPRVSDDMIQKASKQWGMGTDGAANPDQGQGSQSPDPSQRPKQRQGSGQPAPDASQSSPGQGFLAQFLDQSQGGNQTQQGGDQTQVPMQTGERPQQQPSQQQENSQPQQPQSSQSQTTPISGDKTYEGDTRLGPAIERGLSWIGGIPQRRKEQQVQESIKEMERIAVQGPPQSEEEMRRFFARHAPQINEAPPEIRREMIEIFGEEKLRPYLERGQSSNG